MKEILILTLAMIVCVDVLATPAAADSLARNARVSYYGSFDMGAMIGCQNCAATGKTANISIATVHGIRFAKRAYIGLGVGFDAYETWKTMPLFGRASWDLFGKRDKVFVQLDYGYSKGYAEEERSYIYSNMRSEGGKMIGSSIGYRVNVSRLSVVFTAGYKFQRVIKHYDYQPFPYPTFNSFVPLPAGSREVRQDMERFVVGMSFGWR